MEELQSIFLLLSLQQSSCIDNLSMRLSINLLFENHVLEREINSGKIFLHCLLKDVSASYLGYLPRDLKRLGYPLYDFLIKTMISI